MVGFLRVHAEEEVNPLRRASDGQPASAAAMLLIQPVNIWSRLEYDPCVNRVIRQCNRGWSVDGTTGPGRAPATLVTEASRPFAWIDRRSPRRCSYRHRAPVFGWDSRVTEPIRVQRSRRLWELSPTVPDLRGRCLQTVTKVLPRTSLIFIDIYPRYRHQSPEFDRGATR